MDANISLLDRLPMGNWRAGFALTVSIYTPPPNVPHACQVTRLKILEPFLQSLSYFYFIPNNVINTPPVSEVWESNVRLLKDKK